MRGDLRKLKEMYPEMAARVCQQPAAQPVGVPQALPGLPHLAVCVMEPRMHECGSSAFEKSEGRCLGLMKSGQVFQVL